MREPHTQRDVTPDDPVAAPQPPVNSEQVHRAALPLDQAVASAVELRHDRPGIAAEHQRVGVDAIGGDDLVSLSEGLKEPRGHRLLAGVEVQVAADLALAKRPLTGFLEDPHEHHLAVELYQAFGIRSSSAVAGRVPPAGASSCFRHRASLKSTLAGRGLRG